MLSDSHWSTVRTYSGLAIYRFWNIIIAFRPGVYAQIGNLTPRRYSLLETAQILEWTLGSLLYLIMHIFLYTIHASEEHHPSSYLFSFPSRLNNAPAAFPNVFFLPPSPLKVLCSTVFSFMSVLFTSGLL